jgi:predicted RNase H-like HicB family nuclease
MNTEKIIFEVREDEVDGGFVARALRQSIVTQAETWEELRGNVREAVQCHFDEWQNRGVSLTLRR